MLFDRHTSCLVVIGRSAVFPRQAAARSTRAAGRAHRLADAGGPGTRDSHYRHRLRIIANDGPLVPELASLLPEGGKVFDKLVFGLADQPDIRAAIDACGRTAFRAGRTGRPMSASRIQRWALPLPAPRGGAGGCLWLAAHRITMPASKECAAPAS
jgi:hypothetical protein